MSLDMNFDLRITQHSNSGGRQYMEDMFSVACKKTSDKKDLEYVFFGIFDGHGGKEAAIFAKDHLMNNIVEQKNFWSDKDEDVSRAIRDGYIKTHHAMWQELHTWPKTSSGLPSTAGTTASIAFIRKGKIYIGHVGDSAIILGHQNEGNSEWEGESLTVIHKPGSSVEKERIKKLGGNVIDDRVVWNHPTPDGRFKQVPFLAVSRSLGDFWSYNRNLNEFVVSPEPEVNVVPVDLKSHRCLIFGSDGLWDVLTPQKAVSFVQAVERNNLIVSQQTGPGADQQVLINQSKNLVDEALSEWSTQKREADNTSAITVMLDPQVEPSTDNLLMNIKKKTHCVTLSMILPSACPSQSLSEQQQEIIQDPEISSNDLVSCEINNDEKPIDKIITEKTTGVLMVNGNPDSTSENPDSIPLLETLADNLSPTISSQPYECFQMTRQNAFYGEFGLKLMLPDAQVTSDKSLEQRKSRNKANQRESKENSHVVKALKFSSRTELHSAKRRSQITSLPSQVMPVRLSSTQGQEKSRIESLLKISMKENLQSETTAIKINDLTGSKGRQRLIQDEADKQIPGSESRKSRKRKTCSEDQTCPSDENNPVNKVKIKIQKLRWPDSSTKLLSSSKKSRNTKYIM